VQSTSFTTGEAWAIEEDAGSIDDTSVAALAVSEDAGGSVGVVVTAHVVTARVVRCGVGDVVELELLGGEHGGVGTDRHCLGLTGGSVTEVGAELGLDRPTFTMGSNFGDLDNDGWLDAYLATGDPQFESLIPNRMYRNDQGRRFREVTASGGFGHLQKGHGVAFGDIDGDGDQDLLANQGGAYAGDGYYKALFLNPGHGNRWVTLVLEGSTANRAAIGARLKLTLATAEGPRILHATVGSGSSFGGNSLRQEIGLGQAQRLELVEVTWPGSGRVQAFDGLEMDSSYRLREGEASAELLSAR